MHIVVSCAALHAAHKDLAKVVKKNKDEPVFEKVALRAEGRELILEGTDNVTGLRITERAQVYDAGEVAVHIQEFRSLVEGLKLDGADEVEIVQDPNSFKLTCSTPDGSWTVYGDSAKNLPVIPKIEDCSTGFFLNTKTLGRIVKRFAAFPANVHMFPDVLFEREGAVLRAVATDSVYLLIEDCLTEEAAPPEGFNVRVPFDALVATSKLFNKDGSAARLSVGENTMGLSFGSREVMIRLSERAFPHYREIVKAAYRGGSYTETTADRAAFEKGMRVLRTAMKGHEKPFVVLQAEEGGDTLMAASRVEDGRGGATRKIPAKIDGPRCRAGFNVTYLLAFCSAQEKAVKEIRLRVAAEKAPAIFTSDGTEGFFSMILMPVNL